MQMLKPSPVTRKTLIATVVFGALCLAALIFTGGRAPASSGLSSAVEPLPTGCVAKGSRLREHGPRKKRTVALTFDGGPTKYYTPRVLRKLRRAGVPATFFIRGQFIHGHAGLARSREGLEWHVSSGR
jgi:peptidoglycan/xylan/chitin deacetylase (PgdA/CDA1 family)